MDPFNPMVARAYQESNTFNYLANRVQAQFIPCSAAQLTIMHYSHAIDDITPPTLLGPEVRLGLRLSLPESPTTTSFDCFAQMATQLPAGANLDSPQIKLWIEYDRAFKPMNADSLRKCLHKDFRHVPLPRSIGEPERNKEEWVEAMAGFFNSITVFEVGSTQGSFLLVS